MPVFDTNVAIVTAPDTSGSLIDWRTTDGGRRVPDTGPGLAGFAAALALTRPRDVSTA